MDLSEIPLWQRRNWSTDVSTSAPLLVALAADTDVDVRVGVAENFWTPHEVLAQLAGDRAAEVRAAVARNRRTPPEVRDQLTRDEEVTVRRPAARSSNRTRSRAPVERDERPGRGTDTG